MRKISAATVGLMMMASTVAACSGSDKAATDRAPSTTQSVDNGAHDFTKFADDASKAKIKITYWQAGGNAITIAQNGKGKSAYSVDGSTIYSDGESTVRCESTGADATCTQLPSAIGNGGSPLTAFTQTGLGLSRLGASVNKGHVSSATIVGRDARCIAFKASDFAGGAALGSGAGSDPIGEATICVDKKTGFLLKLEETVGGSKKRLYLATDVGEPTDADVNPPSTPQTIPTP